VEFFKLLPHEWIDAKDLPEFVRTAGLGGGGLNVNLTNAELMRVFFFF
jgi:hypothetical protein